MDRSARMVSRPSMPDPWAPGRRLTLDGPLEPTSNPKIFGLTTASLGILATFILFQLIVSPVVLIGVLFFQLGTGMASLVNDPEALLSSYGHEVLVTNAISQWLAFAIPALILARLHASKITAFLRVRRTSGLALGLSFAGMVALLPVAQWLAGINQQLPIPESIRLFDEQTMKLVEQVLQSDFGLGFGLMVMAVTPAVCEELIFRGYAQRQFERAVSPAAAIALSGLLFGAYHLRLTQLLPLAVIGLYLAYLTWRTGSLWPAIIAHFANNGIIVASSQMMDMSDEATATVAEGVSVPWYAVVLGIASFAGIIYAFETYVRPPDETPPDPGASAEDAPGESGSDAGPRRSGEDAAA